MYSNPIVRGMNPDPSVCRAGQDYYLAASTMFLYPGVPIHHSRDLIHWRLIGHCLTRPAHFQPDKTHGPPMIYAPTLRYHNGVFTMITTNVHGGGNFYVTATDPAGPWSDPIPVDSDVFDPSLLFDDDGKVYYTRRGALHEKDVVQAEIDIKTGRLLTPLRSIGHGMVSDDAEGPHLYHIGDWYYLLLAEGGSLFLHMASVGRSHSPWGPFEPCPHNPILAQQEAWWHPIKSIGHGDLVEAHDGSWWIVFLGTRHESYHALTILGRETFLAPVEWRDGWPVVNKQAQRQLTVDAPTLPLQAWEPPPPRDDFDADRFGLEWTFLSVPLPSVCTLGERPGWLRLWGQASRLEEGTQTAFAGRHQRDFHGEASARLEFAPAGEGDEAGLTVFHRHGYHYDLFRTVREGRPALVLRKCVGDIVHEQAIAAVPGGPLRLRVTATPDVYLFAWAADDDHWQAIGTGLTQLLTAEVTTTWVGNMIGLYATGNGSACAAPADFDWFEYKGRDA